ncbi:hypothetical protein [Microbulbifer guangxiensis]|uniref:hypothetical protein n=1 Tax=Microbulbifer guangxiensis TaxID=2904249 RepID=UPI001F352667|nr:hypothetical protein [Microbulbifer guangxiensis]
MRIFLAVFIFIFSVCAGAQSEEEIYKEAMQYVTDNQELVFAISFIFNASTKLKYCGSRFASELSDVEVAYGKFNKWIKSLDDEMDTPVERMVLTEFRVDAEGAAMKNIEERMVLQACESLVRLAKQEKLPPKVIAVLNGLEKA